MTATTPLTCDGFANALADYLERDDSPRVRAAVETHAASCARCGALLAEVQQLRVDASGLPALTPSRDLWAGIAERIATPVVGIGQRAGGSGQRERQARRMPAWLRPAAAAAALVAVTAGVTYFATREALLQQPRVAAVGVDTVLIAPERQVPEANEAARRGEVMGTRVAAAPSNERTAPVATRYRPPATRTPAVLTSNQPDVQATLDAVYGREIARLRRIIDERRGLLDTATVGVIERNLVIIDQAIGESRAALARDPASGFLNEQLNNALEQKVELLRAAALLPVRT